MRNHNNAMIIHQITTLITEVFRSLYLNITALLHQLAKLSYVVPDQVCKGEASLFLIKKKQYLLAQGLWRQLLAVVLWFFSESSKSLMRCINDIQKAIWIRLVPINVRKGCCIRWQVSAVHDEKYWLWRVQLQSAPESITK